MEVREFKNLIQNLSGVDLIVLKCQKKVELQEIESEILERVRRN